jgi:hypothetical protein
VEKKKKEEGQGTSPTARSFGDQQGGGQYL